MPSSLVSTTAGRPVLATAPRDIRCARREHRPDRLPDRERHRLQAVQPGRGEHTGGGRGGTEQHRRPLHRLGRDAERLGQAVLHEGIQRALPDLVEHQTPQQTLLRPRSPGRTAPRPRPTRSAAEPGTAESGDLLEGGVDVVHRELGSGRRRRQRR